MDLTSKGILFVVSAPAGCGKDTVLDELKKKNLQINKTVSVTTRSERPGEKNGVDYYFTDKETFLKRVNNGEFLEYTEYNGNFYGTLKSEVEKCLEKGGFTVLKIEVEGAENVRKAVPDCVCVFIAPPSMEELETRLRNRGTEDEKNLRERLETAKTEISRAKEYDYIALNDTVEKCAERISAIMKAESMRCSRMTHITENLI